MNLRSLFFEDPVAQALEAWRSAASLVSDRWQQFLAADDSTRPMTFAAYVAALDLEAAAADALCTASRGA
jgi:hypothetical protein